MKLEDILFITYASVALISFQMVTFQLIGLICGEKNELKHYGTGETVRNGFLLRKGVFSHVSGSFGGGPDAIAKVTW